MTQYLVLRFQLFQETFICRNKLIFRSDYLMIYFISTYIMKRHNLLNFKDVVRDTKYGH